MPHAPSGGRPRVTWFELFYDLVLVATVLQGSRLFDEAPSIATGAWLAVTLVVLLTLWLATTLSFNAAREDWGLRRVLTLVQMLALVVASLSISRSAGLSDTVGFLGLAVAFACVAVLYAVPGQPAFAGRRWPRTMTACFALAALLCCAGAAFADATAPVWRNPASYALALALVAALVPVLASGLGGLASSGILDRDHLSERLGQLVMIALGESFADLVLSLGDLDAIPDPVFVALTFFVVYAVWSVYFRAVLPSGVPAQTGRARWWISAHALLIFGAIGAAGAFAALAAADGEAASTLASFRLSLPLAYVVAALLVLAWAREGTDRRIVAVHGSAVALLVAVTAAGAVLVSGQAVVLGVLASAVVIADALAIAWVTRGTARRRGWLRPGSPG